MSRGYRLYVLALLTLIYAINFVDRQIVTVLAPELKRDLALTDAQVGLLFGTAFALFYALFGLPLARLADGWNRVRTLSLGLALWSGMTALSGMAGSFAALALARVGVGLGEASASPAAMSILQDYFPRDRRATALAVYSSGIYLGAGASLVLGGGIVAWWANWGDAAPLALRGWQAAYLLIGGPGILLALLAWATVREPVRGASEGRPHTGDPHPFRAAAAVAATLFPPFSLFAAWRAGGARAGLRNAALLAACAGGAALLVRWTDGLLDPARRGVIAAGVTTNAVQWSAIAVGLYATLSWAAAIRRRDPAAARLILDTPSFLALAVGGGIVSLASYGLSAFIVLFAVRYLGQGPEAGYALGALAAVAGGLGTATGGVLADRAKRAHPAGRVWLVIGALALAALCLLMQYTADGWGRFLLFHTLATFLLTMWLGPVFATCQDHVLPRMRGTGTAVQFLATNLIGLGLGPYLLGLVSDATGDLRLAALAVLPAFPVALALFAFAAIRLPQAEATVAARAGE